MLQVEEQSAEEWERSHKGVRVYKGKLHKIDPSNKTAILGKVDRIIFIAEFKRHTAYYIIYLKLSTADLGMTQTIFIWSNH